IMVEGNDDLKIYRNLVSYVVPTNAAGAYVIHTNQPFYETQWSMAVEGYSFNPLQVFRIFMSGYSLSQSYSGYVYEGANKLPVRMGSESGNLVIIIGDPEVNYQYFQMTVTEFQVSWYNLDESYADGWTITRETDLTPYSAMLMTDRSYTQWTEIGADIYRLTGNVGIGTSTPSCALDVQFSSGYLCAIRGYSSNGYEGRLGDYNYAVYGKDNNYSGNYGYLGGSSNGAYAYHGITGNHGILASENAGVYGSLHTVGTADGRYAVTGSGIYVTGINGSGYNSQTSIGGTKGFNLYGNAYSFGVGGFSYLDYSRSGGTIGGTYSGTTPWGCLAYKNSSGSSYGGYFTSSTTGTGKSYQSGNTQINIGIGSWGDLFGADIHGNIYGIFTEGSHYGLFSNGHVFRNKLDVHLQQNEDQTNTVLFSNVSTDVTVQTSGYGQLSAGRCAILFDENFKKVASEEFPVVITVTPVGSTQGIFLEQVGHEGFTVAENNAGRSNVEFSYIAIARRKGYENPQLPKEVVVPDYIGKLARGLHNDSDTFTDGEGLYLENSELYVGKHSSALPDLSRKMESDLEE
ncbi:MAG: hypothetical protein K0B08_12210, partial [Bacteroidales bacterium]|nr:hypothetical protein [Bacteroidales bacterium]